MKEEIIFMNFTRIVKWIGLLLKWYWLSVNQNFNKLLLKAKAKAKETSVQKSSILPNGAFLSVSSLGMVQCWWRTLICLWRERPLWRGGLWSWMSWCSWSPLGKRTAQLSDATAHTLAAASSRVCRSEGCQQSSPSMWCSGWYGLHTYKYTLYTVNTWKTTSGICSKCPFSKSHSIIFSAAEFSNRFFH